MRDAKISPQRGDKFRKGTEVRTFMAQYADVHGYVWVVFLRGTNPHGKLVSLASWQDWARDADPAA